VTLPFGLFFLGLSHELLFCLFDDSFSFELGCPGSFISLYIPKEDRQVHAKWKFVAMTSHWTLPEGADYVFGRDAALSNNALRLCICLDK
jgi:hypothetical protein